MTEANKKFKVEIKRDQLDRIKSVRRKPAFLWVDGLTLVESVEYVGSTTEVASLLTGKHDRQNYQERFIRNADGSYDKILSWTYQDKDEKGKTVIKSMSNQEKLLGSVELFQETGILKYTVNWNKGSEGEEKPDPGVIEVDPGNYETQEEKDRGIMLALFALTGVIGW